MMDLYPGDILDSRYQITELIGVGGMARVYKACEVGLDRTVAIKLLHLDLSSETTNRTRFLQEGKALSLLEHPNIVRCFRFGFHEDCPYIAVEYVDGCSLTKLIAQDGRISPVRLADIAAGVSAAMSYTHLHNIIHRDLKPANILISSEGTQDLVKIADFGIARILPGEGKFDQHLTQTGMLIGSLHYMSPEACLGKQQDQRSDIYSLGCVLYECLSGHPPFEADNPITLLHMHVNGAPKKLKTNSDDLSDGLVDLIMRCLSKEPSQRYQSMKEVTEALESIRLQAKNTRPDDHRNKMHRALSRHQTAHLFMMLTFISVAGFYFFHIFHPSQTRYVDTLEQTKQEEIQRCISRISTANRKKGPLIFQEAAYLGSDLAKFYCKEKRFPEAVQQLNQLLSYARKELPEDHIDIASIEMALADVYRKNAAASTNAQEKVALNERALDYYRAANSEPSIFDEIRAEAIQSQCLLLVEMGRLSDARKSFDELKDLFLSINAIGLRFEELVDALLKDFATQLNATGQRNSELTKEDRLEICRMFLDMNLNYHSPSGTHRKLFATLASNWFDSAYGSLSTEDKSSPRIQLLMNQVRSLSARTCDAGPDTCSLGNMVMSARHKKVLKSNKQTSGSDAGSQHD